MYIYIYISQRYLFVTNVFGVSENVLFCEYVTKTFTNSEYVKRIRANT